MSSYASKTELPVWKFAIDKLDAGEALGFHSAECDDSGFSDVPAGKAWDQYEIAMHRCETVGWYRVHIDVKKNPDTRHYLDFDGVGGIFAVYVNGEKAAEELQRYLPATVDIEDFLRDGENLIAIKVDNRHRKSRHLTGGKIIEWLLYGGLIHKVYLTEEPVRRISHIFVKAEHTGEAAIEIEVRNDGRETLDGSVEIEFAGERAQEKVVCAAGESAKVKLNVCAKKITPWSPDTPALYELCASLRDGDGREIYSARERTGFRTIECRGTHILLNGSELFIKGANRYDEYDPWGPSVPEDKIREDLLLMKSCGMNFVRTHYEQDPAIYRIADEIGIMYMLEVPLNWWAPVDPDEDAAKNGGVFSADEDWCGSWDSLERIAETNLDITFERFCNHPCWVVWSMSNECRHFTKDGIRILSSLAARARGYDSGRLITNVACIDPKTREELDYCDFIGFNAYDGMLCAPEQKAVRIGEFGEKVYDSATKRMAAIRDLFPDKPIVMTEFGGRSIYGVHGDFPESEDHHAEYIRCVCRAFLSIEEIRGLVLWSWADYHHNWDMEEPFGPYGVVTVDRKIKAKPCEAMKEVFESIK